MPCPFPTFVEASHGEKIIIILFFSTKLTKRAKNRKENRNNDGKRVELFECFVYFYRAASHQNPLVSAICFVAFRFSLKLSCCFSFCDWISGTGRDRDKETWQTERKKKKKNRRNKSVDVRCRAFVFVWRAHNNLHSFNHVVVCVRYLFDHCVGRTHAVYQIPETGTSILMNLP